MEKTIKIEIAVGIILIIAVILGGFWWLGNKNNSGKAPAKQGTTGTAVVGIENKLIVTSPKANEVVASPIKISGRAIGPWFFEGNFPVQVFDENNKFLGSGPAQFVAKSENDTWMTEKFVDFAGSIKFEQPGTAAGYLLFEKDNPSGNPAMAESYKLPIKFGNSPVEVSGNVYTNTQYGFQLTFPDTWKGYSVKHRTLHWGNNMDSDSIDFGFPKQDGLFNISFHSPKQYDTISSSGEPFGMKLGENNGVVLVWDQAQFAEDSLTARYGEIPDIIKTFKIIK